MYRIGSIHLKGLQVLTEMREVLAGDEGSIDRDEGSIGGMGEVLTGMREVLTKMREVY